jgi:phosphate transport system substrate-binding protein
MRPLSGIAVLGALAAMVGCSGTSTDKSSDLRGAGSTFVYPLMVLWANDYDGKEGGCKVEYHAWGSQGGIDYIMAKKGDFGCSDAPMTEEELAKVRAAGGDIVHVPLVLGAVVPAYHLTEVTEPLRFSGPVLADIYLGKVKKWNDEPLRKLNPGVNLPDKEIVVVHRLDGSGTTDIWTDYLSKVSPEWKKGPGGGTEVKWPTGKAESGNEGVSEYVRQHAGTIGYVELSYAHRKGLSFGLVQNREGEFVKASLPAVTAAADSALKDIPDDLRYSLTNAAGKDSYPISGTTWALIYAQQPAGKGHQLVEFLRWVIDDGQERAEALFYARLPESLASRARKKLDQIQVGQ